MLNLQWTTKVRFEKDMFEEKLVWRKTQSSHKIDHGIIIIQGGNIGVSCNLTQINTISINMKHKITLNNNSPSEYFESNSEFKSVLIKKIKYSNSKDVSTLLCNWLYGPFGGIFSIPISEAYANQQDKFEIIIMSKAFDEPFKGSFNRLDIKLEKEFENDSSELSFEIELL